MPAVTAPRPAEPLWTLEEACEYFAASGLPITPARLRKIIQGLEWEPDERGPSGEQGGRGRGLYKSSDLMILHSRLTEFITTRGIRRRQPKRQARG